MYEILKSFTTWIRKSTLLETANAFYILHVSFQPFAMTALLFVLIFNFAVLNVCHVQILFFSVSSLFWLKKLFLSLSATTTISSTNCLLVRSGLLGAGGTFNSCVLKKVKLSMCLIKWYVLKWGDELLLDPCIIFGTGCEWLALHPGFFTTQKRLSIG